MKGYGYFLLFGVAYSYALRTPERSRQIESARSTRTAKFECSADTLLDWAICDETLDNEKPAMLQDVTTISRQYLKMNITRLIGLEDCACCSIAISKRSDMMLCNRRKTYARIPYAFVGMVGRAISDSEQCATPTEVKGYWTWDDAFQSWTLYVLGAGSPLLDGPMTCAELLEPEESSPTTASAVPTPGESVTPALSTDAVSGAKGSPTRGSQAGAKGAPEPSELANATTPNQSLALGYPADALSEAKSSPTRGAESGPMELAKPSELAKPAAPKESVAPAYPTDALSGAKISPTRGSKPIPKAPARPSELAGTAMPNESEASSSDYPTAVLSGGKSFPTRGAKAIPKVAPKPPALADQSAAGASPLQESSSSGSPSKAAGRRRKSPHLLGHLRPI